MIEIFLKSIIEEFGPTGVLLIGIVFFGNLAYKKIINHLWHINKNITRTNELLEKLGQFWEHKLGGKI
jgi:hypothetical protein